MQNTTHSDYFAELCRQNGILSDKNSDKEFEYVKMYVCVES